MNARRLDVRDAAIAKTLFVMMARVFGEDEGEPSVRALRSEASRCGIDEVFVLADDEDAHAVAFYRALGGAPSAVTMLELNDDR